jgi:hypothetical protein
MLKEQFKKETGFDANERTIEYGLWYNAHSLKENRFYLLQISKKLDLLLSGKKGDK